MRLSVVFLILTIVVCAMFQESESFLCKTKTRKCKKCCCKSRCCKTTTTSTTSTTTTTTTTTAAPGGRKRRDIMDSIPFEFQNLIQNGNYNKFELENSTRWKL
ncbi:PREDICTED: salivary glue protein Sgs-3 [Acromyrmex echinatior]|uniref:salivary glue protein Sgs-3 n=1 Tax=Acromyrmex echinatior TaxID=103372 RepID=UPI000580CF58|nr:PREDICTED: salivary glue protein Sgs-3 [Acromyrmex echinatior]